MKKVLVKYSIFITVILGLFGCGVKGNPVVLLIVKDNEQIVQNFKATTSDNAVNLKWDILDKNFKSSYLAVEKSELGSVGNECKDCPRTYERIGKILLKDKMQERKGFGSFVFSDRRVSRDKTYNYRLLFCDDLDVCFESAITEINFK